MKTDAQRVGICYLLIGILWEQCELFSFFAENTYPESVFQKQHIFHESVNYIAFKDICFFILILILEGLMKRRTKGILLATCALVMGSLYPEACYH